MTIHTRVRALPARLLASLFVAAILALGSAAFAQSDATTSDPVVIRLGSREERASEIDWRFGVTLRGVAAQQGQPYSEVFEASMWELLPYYIEQRVQEVALAAEAQRRGIVPNLDELNATMDRIKAGLAEGQEFEAVVNAAGFPSEAALQGMIEEADVIKQLLDAVHADAEASVTDEEVHVRYLAERGRFSEPEQYCARHILVSEEAVAQELVAQLAGGADFAALAAEYGTDATNTRGGDLGCFEVSRMVPEFANAVVAAPVGESVGPVASQFGYHVVLVYDHTPARVRPFSEVKDEAREFAVALATNAAIDGIVNGAGVTVYPENLPTR